MTVMDQVVRLVSEASDSSVSLDTTEWGRVNPKWTMVARVFVNMLQNDVVRPRLLQAENVSELKAVLFVDYYLTLIQDNLFHHQVQALLANPTVPLAVIAYYAALSFARDAVWQCTPDMMPDRGQFAYPIAAVAAHTGMDVEMLYRKIASGEIDAELMMPWAEVEQLLLRQDNEDNH
jgi:hypothetical protein